MAAIGIGVLGAGRMGALHAQIIASQLSGAELIAIADVQRELAEAAAVPVRAKAVGPEDLLADPAVRAVVIATPPRTHCALIDQAARSGKHVFCEKPLGWSLEEIDAALAVVEEAGVKLQVGLNRRFDPSFVQAHELIAAGEIGSPLTAVIISRDPIDFRPRGRIDGDIFLDTTVHDLDMARFLIGSEAGAVFVQGGVMADEPLDDPDTAVTILKFENDAVVTIDNTRISRHGYDQRAEVVGTNGMVSVENVRAHTASIASGETVNSSGAEPFFDERYFDSYVRELQSFVDCIASDREPAVTGLDGRAAVALALACIRSYRERRSVTVSEVETV